MDFGLETQDDDDDDDDAAAAAEEVTATDVDEGFRFLSPPLLPPLELVSVCLLHKFPQPSA